MIVLVAVLLVLLVQPNFQSTFQSSFPSLSPLRHTPRVRLEQVIHGEVKYFCCVTGIVFAICKISLNDTLLKANKTPNKPTQKSPQKQNTHTKKPNFKKKKKSPTDFQNSVDSRRKKNGREGREKCY